MKTIALMAITLDGKIAKNRHHFPDWTGKADKKRFVQLTKRAGVVVMGSRTFDTIGKPLADRLNIIMTRNKDRKSAWDNLIYTDETPQDLLARLETEGFSEVILAGGAVINSLFARQHLIDEIIVTVSPKVFGAGISLFTDDIAMELALLEVEQLDDNLVYLKYQVV
jgi:dihydrofolate reductase